MHPWCQQAHHRPTVCLDININVWFWLMVPILATVCLQWDTGRAAAAGCADGPRARGTSLTEFRSAANICTKPARAWMLTVLQCEERRAVTAVRLQLSCAAARSRRSHTDYLVGMYVASTAARLVKHRQEVKCGGTGCATLPPSISTSLLPAPTAVANETSWYCEWPRNVCSRKWSFNFFLMLHQL